MPKNVSQSNSKPKLIKHSTLSSIPEEHSKLESNTSNFVSEIKEKKEDIVKSETVTSFQSECLSTPKTSKIKTPEKTVEVKKEKPKI